MGDYHFMVCKTCEKTCWLADSEIHEFIQEHQGHVFTILTEGVWCDTDSFEGWFRDFMGWKEEAEG